MLVHGAATVLPSGLMDRLDGQAAAVESSRLLRMAERVHGSGFRPLVLTVDAIVIAGAVAATGSPASLVGASTLLVPLGVLTGLYLRRSALETQGVGWYLRALAVNLAFGWVMLWMLQPAGTRQGDAVRVVAVVGLARGMLAAGLWLWIAAARRRGQGLQSTLVSGPTTAVVQVVRRISAFPECGMRVVAVHSPLHGPDKRDPHRVAPSGSERQHKRVLDLIDRREVQSVLLVSAGGDSGAYDELVHRGDGSGIEYSIVVPLDRLAARHARARVSDLGILPLGQVNYHARPMPGKRLFDIAASSVLLLLMLPVLAVVAAAVKLSDGGPAFYGQRRVGLHGREFKMWKFRSMVVDADRMVDDHLDRNVNDGLLFKLEDDPRITRVGKMIRRLSIDELPQIYNVFKGDMSLVGPRPLPVDPDAFDEVAAKRHSARPGITGPWQVHGGHALSYEDMISLDLGYISGWSFRKDLGLLLRTIPALLVRRAPVI